MRATMPKTQVCLTPFAIAGFWVGLIGCNTQLQRPCESTGCVPVTLSVAADDPHAVGTDGVLALCEAPVRPGVHIAGAWADSTDAIDVNLSWMLPSGGRPPVRAEGWESAGVETIDEGPDSIPDGLHWLGVELPGAGIFTDLNYSVRFLNSAFCYSGREVSPERKGIAIGVLNGESTILFNSWVDAEDPMGGGPTGKQAVEFQVGVRDATDDVDLQLEIRLPSGDAIPASRQGWERNTFERIAIDRRDVLEEGTYELFAFLNGAGAFAQVTVDIRFGEVTYHDVMYVESGWSLSSKIEFRDGRATHSGLVDE
ncbi:MAG: hypothetical protein H6819_07100 [Phycisphaerales bacterium]|nr:hypothetical protein [Phycisphaerales bacterium]MCB9855349.1 hypothetical protein [Phycisphaerales bacterium]MCB9862942.1 hypothetical protein [Phycisphaerales bacterium]